MGEDQVMALNPDVLAGLTQAGATVVAVVVGFGLSFASDVRTRRVIREQADREQRLEYLLGLIDRLNIALSGMRSVMSSLSLYFGMAMDSATAIAARGSALASARRRAEGESQAVAMAILEARRFGLGLRMLRLEAGTLGLVDQAVEACISIDQGLDAVLAGSETSSANVDSSIVQLSTLLDRLIESGDTL